ncbi:MAG: twin-arginine translocation signal domain-containing protein [Alphaproteobacteria bacterium]|nr:twin-arginine translocation signal domain-containing protein [Alphaproteobacteria bacterium]
MLTKKINGVANGPRLKQALASVVGTTINRRAFLAQSGLAAGGAALATAVPLGTVKKAKAQNASGTVKKIKSVCTHCAVGCTVIAEVDNGVWVGQEPGFESRINLGAHCARVCAVLEHAHSERRLKYLF